jgi:hypothetical protein
MLKQQFEFIIGNPPWLSYRFIADPDYQDEIKRRAVDKYKIAPKSQKLFTQMELGTVFLAHSMATFAKQDARLAFVLPRAVLSADQHQNLILRKYSPDARFTLTGYWDLFDVMPLFNVPACVLFARRDVLKGSPKDELPAIEWSGKLPARDVSWQVARKHLATDEKKGRVIYMGTRVALSTAPGGTAPTKPSKYQNTFKQGATIVPRSFYFVRVQELNGAEQPDREYWAETDPEQALLAKKPYTDVELDGPVEGRFIYCGALARHVLPFGLLAPSTLVLPVTARDGALGMIKADAMSREGYRGFAKWMRDAEEIWAKKRADKADRQDAYQWLDYQGKLTAQNLSQRYLVLYNGDGMNVSATMFDRRSFPLRFVVDRTVYWAALSTVDEAHYLTAVLNSQTVNLAIKPFQSRGLLGERHVHKKLLELPIPIYDHEKQTHTELAELGRSAYETVASLLARGKVPDSSTARQRAFIRNRVEAELKQIDKLIAKLLSK